jgi:hypothetical protein
MVHSKKTNVSFKIKCSLILNLLSLLFKLMFGISTPLFHKKIMNAHGKKGEQAGLSRATLKISSEFSSKFLLRTHKSQSKQWLFLRYSPFDILRSSSVVDRLHFKYVFHSSSLDTFVKFDVVTYASI